MTYSGTESPLAKLNVIKGLLMANTAGTNGNDKPVEPKELDLPVEFDPELAAEYHKVEEAADLAEIEENKKTLEFAKSKALFDAAYDEAIKSIESKSNS